MSAPLTVKNAINTWMNTVGQHSFQALSEFTTARVIKELSPSGAMSFIENVTAIGACFFPLVNNAAQIAGGLTIIALKQGVTKPDPGRSGAPEFQRYARTLLNRSRDNFAKNLHAVADYRWTAVRFPPPGMQSAAFDDHSFTVGLLRSTFKPQFILNAENGTFKGNVITPEIRSKLKPVYERVKRQEAIEACLRLPGLCIPPNPYKPNPRGFGYVVSA